MKALKLIIVLLLTFISSYAQERVSATYDVSFSKNVATAYINDKQYHDVVVYIETSKQGYTLTYASGYSRTKHTWVKVKVKDSNNKTVYSKKIKRSGLFVFESGKRMQIGKPDNIQTEAILEKEASGEWYFEINEKGID